MKRTILAIALISLLTACQRTPSNVYVLSTTDCGKSWTQIPTGQSVPVHTGNVCGYNMAVPNWPMTGDVKFKTGFDKKVLSNATISYTYNIVNPIAFVSNARFLGKMGSSLEISSESIGSQYENAENIIIDRILREVTTELTSKIDVVDCNPAALEDEILKQSRTELEKRGVQLNDISLVIVNDDQTNLAIDTATAMRVYEAANIGELGQRVIAARAGASKIVVETAK